MSGKHLSLNASPLNKKDGKHRCDVCYGITSRAPEQADAQSVLATNRGHWSIENSCHYIIDWNYDEDRSRIRTGYGPENITRLRRFAVGLIKSKGVRSVAQKMRQLTRNTRLVFDCYSLPAASAVFCSFRPSSFVILRFPFLPCDSYRGFCEIHKPHVACSGKKLGWWAGIVNNAFILLLIEFRQQIVALLTLFPAARPLRAFFARAVPRAPHVQTTGFSPGVFPVPRFSAQPARSRFLGSAQARGIRGFFSLRLT